MARKSPKSTHNALKPPSPAASKPKTVARPRVARQCPEPATSKAAQILAALQQPQGATIADLSRVTGWQAHSVRGFLSGTVRKRLGHPLVSEDRDSGRVYRITVGRSAA
jgi:hypothetical protein